MARSRRREPKHPPFGPKRMRAVAYYRSTHPTQAPIYRQQKAVRRWAKRHGIDIIREFVDRGKPARCNKRRPAFHRLIHDWVKRRDNFDYVLCQDVSRWGRWDEMNLLARYAALCQRHGKQLIFTSDPLGCGDPVVAQRPLSNHTYIKLSVENERFSASAEPQERCSLVI